MRYGAIKEQIPGRTGLGWGAFLSDLKKRGFKGVRLFVSDRCLGLVESLAEFYPDCGHSALMLATARLRYTYTQNMADFSVFHNH